MTKSKSPWREIVFLKEDDSRKSKYGSFPEIGYWENGDYRLTMHHGERFYAVMYMPAMMYGIEDTSPDKSGTPYIQTKIYYAETRDGIEALKDNFAAFVAKKLV